MKEEKIIIDKPKNIKDYKEIKQYVDEKIINQVIVFKY